jgi:peptidyl-prolyl cis-trans isomerase SurA
MSQLFKRLLLLALITPSFAFAQVALDKIVAIVSGEPVTQQEVTDKASINMRVWDLQSKQIEADPQAPADLKNRKKPTAEEFQAAAFNEVLQDRVLMNQAKRTGITLSQNELDKQIEAVAKSNGAQNTEKFKARIISIDGQKGWNSFLRDMRYEMTVARMLERDVDNKVQVSEAEIDKALEGAPETQPVAVASHLYVDGLGPNSQAKINTAKARLTKGEDFAVVAAEMTERKGSEKLYETFLTDESMSPEVLNALKKQALGSVGNIVKTNNGFYLFNVIERKEKPVDAAARRKYVRELIKQSKIDSAQEAWIKETLERNKSSIVIK